MKQVLIIFVFLTSNAAFSQSGKIGFELNYPHPVGGNFIADNYKGIADIALKYQIANLEFIRIDAAINTTMLKDKSGLYDSLGQVIHVNVMQFQPEICAAFKLKTLDKIQPTIGIGYAFVLYKVKENSSANSTEKGLAITTGINYYFNENFNIHLKYNFMKLMTSEGIPDTSYNTQIGLTKIGVGFRF